MVNTMKTKSFFQNQLRVGIMSGKIKNGGTHYGTKGSFKKTN